MRAGNQAADVQLVMPDRLAAKHPASAVGATLIMAGLVFFQPQAPRCAGSKLGSAGANLSKQAIV